MGVEIPKFDESSNTISIPEVENVVFTIGGKPVEGDVVITKNTTVRVSPKPGYVLAKGVERNHRFEARKLDQPTPKVQAVEPSVEEPPKPAEPVEVHTAGSTPENVNQQASQAEAGSRTFGNRNR